MYVSNALIVLRRNQRRCENTLLYDLWKRGVFSPQHFWDYYDSVVALAKDQQTSGHSVEAAGCITFIYQKFLEACIYHFDPQDESYIADFPPNYQDYLERLDGALDAYFRGVWINENAYQLPHP